MSIRYWVYNQYTPPFQGTVDEEQRNFLGHKWEKVKVVQMHGSPDCWATICSVCRVQSGDEGMKYPCGTVPPKIGWDEYKKIMVSLGRQDELPDSHLHTNRYKG